MPPKRNLLVQERLNPLEGSRGPSLGSVSLWVAQVVVEGPPAPWGVDAFRLGNHAALRDRKKSKAFKKRVRAATLKQYHGPTYGPHNALRLDTYFFMQRPKSVKRALPTVKPDLTNLRKCGEDGLRGLVYTDDALVIQGWSEKIYAKGEPYSVLEVYLVEGDLLD